MPDNCDIVQIFAGGGPGGATVEIDNFSFVPSPFISITQEKYTNNKQVIGGVWRITLNGTIVNNSFDLLTSSGTLPGNPAQKFSVKEILNKFKTSDCVSVLIQCSGTFINGNGRVLSVSFDQGNQPTWVNIVPYTIEIELFSNDYNGTQELVVKPSTGVVPNNCLLSSYDESFTISVGEDAFNWDNLPGSSPTPNNVTSIGNQHLRVSFNISATGIDGGGCIAQSGTYYGLDGAERAIVARIADLREMDITSLTETPNTPTGPDNIVNHIDGYYNSGIKLMEFRNVTVNPVTQSIEVGGELIIRPSGCVNPNLFTTMTVEESVEGDGRTVTISGTVKAVFDTNFTVSEIIKYNKFNCNEINRMTTINTFLNTLAANTDLLNNIANSSSHTTKTYLTDSCSSLSSINNPCVSASTQPSSSPLLCDLRLISSQLGRDYGAGTGNFTFVLTNKANCGVLGAKNVNVDITHDKPADNIVEIIVPGRGDKGPLIQNICCKTSEKYGIRVTADTVTNLCSFNNSSFDSTSSQFQNCINSLIKDLEQKVGVDARCWFLVEDSESFGNNSYSLSRQYVKPSCP